MNEQLKLFGTDWCTKTALLKNYLQSEWVDFEYFNVDEDEQAKEELSRFYNGEVKFPTISLGEAFLKNPKIPELRGFLKEKGVD